MKLKELIKELLDYNFDAEVNFYVDELCSNENES